MDKLVYFFFVAAICFSICGIVTMAMNNTSMDNATVINETLENISEEPIEDGPMEDNSTMDEMSAEEDTEYLQALENQTLEDDSEEDIQVEDIDEPQDEIIEPSESVPEPVEQVEEEEIIQDVVIEPETASNKVKQTPVSAPKKVCIPGIVNSRGYVWVGQKYSNQEVTVIIED